MMGEEKEIKRTLSCQDFVTLHILVQVMFFWSSLLALERFLLFHLEKNLFFHLDSLKTTKKFIRVTFLMTLIIVQRRRENTDIWL